MTKSDIPAGNPTDTQTREDAQQLMKALMNVAHPVLQKTGGFAPFAAVLDRTGTETVETSYMNHTDLPAGEIVSRLTEKLREMVACGTVRAAAVASDVHFGKPESGDWRTAVELHIEHENGYCVEIFVPYRVRRAWRKGAGWRVRFSHPVGQEGEFSIFTASQS